MKYLALIVLCLKVVSICSAPMQLQWQSQMSVQPTQEEVLQQQLLVLQQLQMMNELNSNPYTHTFQKAYPPIMVLMPDGPLDSWADINTKNFNNAGENKLKIHDTNDRTSENDDLDSVTIEALEPKPETEPKKVILLIPNRERFSIGGVISAIPFLPIEINVPDTISWIYNGIASIISGIGQNLPFVRPSQTQMPPENLRVFLQRLRTRNQNNPPPILMLPDVSQVFPMRI